MLDNRHGLLTGANPARRIRLLALALLLGACATNRSIDTRSTDTQAPAPEPGIYGIAGGRMVSIGAERSFPGAEAMDDVGAMTWAPEAGRFYAVADASSKPALVAVDPATGRTTMIGPIAAPGLELTLVEGLAFDPGSGTLYAAGGASSFASNVLLRVDPATGAARQVARIRGTIQDEADAMTFVDGALWAADGAGNSSALYRIDLDTGQAIRASQPFAQTVTDLAFDPASRRLYATSAKDGPLLIIALDGASVSQLPASAGALTAVAIIPAGGDTSLFNDGFESGDTSAWPGRPEQQQ